MRLERDYLALQSRALAAPGAALEELRRLRHELLSLKRDRALAEVGAGGRHWFLGGRAVSFQSLRVYAIGLPLLHPPAFCPPAC